MAKYEYSVQALVRQDLVQREHLGQERYGTSLYPNNGRNALVDAYQEALDLACYLRQALAEQGIDPTQIIDQPPPDQGHAVGMNVEAPEHRAAREHAADECGFYCHHDDGLSGDYYGPPAVQLHDRVEPGE